MESVIMMMIAISLLLAAIATIALIWGLKGGQFGEQAGFLSLHDSDEALMLALKFELRQKDFAARGLLLLDRDGVINIDVGYLHEIKKLRYKKGIFKLVKAACCAGYLPVVVTNQSGIARGYFTKEQMHALHRKIAADFRARGAFIRKFYFCPHAPDAKCECRKPAPGMIKAALEEFKKEPSKSIMLGDKQSDLDAASAAGVQKLYLIKDQKDFKRVIDENFSARRFDT